MEVISDVIYPFWRHFFLLASPFTDCSTWNFAMFCYGNFSLFAFLLKYCQSNEVNFFLCGLIQQGKGGYPSFPMSVIAFDISIANIFSLHTALSVMQKSSESVLMLRLVGSNWISWCVWHVIASYLFILSLSPPEMLLVQDNLLFFVLLIRKCLSVEGCV